MGLLAFHVADAVTIGGPEFAARIGGVDVGGHAAADVVVGLNLEYNFAGTGVAQIRTVAFVLVTIPDVKTVVDG